MVSTLTILVLCALAVGGMERLGDSRAPTWFKLILATAIINYAGLAICCGIMGDLRRRLSEEQYDRASERMSWIYASPLLVLWSVAAIMALAAKPSCLPGSDLAVALALINSNTPIDEVESSNCPFVLGALGLATTNAVIIMASLTAALFVPFSQTDKPLFAKYVRRHVSGRNMWDDGRQSGALLDDIDAGD